MVFRICHRDPPVLLPLASSNTYACAKPTGVVGRSDNATTFHHLFGKADGPPDGRRVNADTRTCNIRPELQLESIGL